MGLCSYIIIASLFLIGFPNTIYFIFWLTWVQLLSEFINPDDLLNL